MKVIEYAKAMGLDMIQGDHEDAPGQLELNWTYDNVLRNADRLSCLLYTSDAADEGLV